MSRRIDPALVKMLEKSGSAYEIIPGAKHLHVRVRGRLVLVLPRTVMDRFCTIQNARATLRRALRKKRRI